MHDKVPVRLGASKYNYIYIDLYELVYNFQRTVIYRQSIE